MIKNINVTDQNHKEAYKSAGHRWRTVFMDVFSRRDSPPQY